MSAELDLNDLNPPQFAAVVHRDTPLMVVAGPGSGKTRVLTRRVAALVQEGNPPASILAVTFTNKAASEMKERLQTLLPATAVDRLWVSTFHSACVRMLRYDGESIGISKRFTIYDTNDSVWVLKQIVKELELIDEDSPVKEVTRMAKDLHEAISWAKNHLEDYASAATRFSIPDLAETALAYNTRLRELNALDFDDILLFALQLLRSEASHNYWASKFTHILVDEYQDTNQVQAAIVGQLAGEGRNLCVVGDFDQAIYSWRGSSPELMTAFESRYPGTTVVVLEENYRSTPEILETCQALIDPNPSLHRPKLATSNHSGEDVILYEARDDRDESRWVVDAAEAELQKDADASIAVLCRTIAQTRVFEEELTRRRLPYVIVGSARFFERAEVKDALSWLKCKANPEDLVAFERACQAPRRSLGAKTMAALVGVSRSRGLGITDAARVCLDEKLLAARASSSVSGFLDDLEKLPFADGPAVALETLIYTMGLKLHWEKDRDSVSRLENLAELCTAAADFEQSDLSTASGDKVMDLDGEARTLAFLEHATLLSSTDVEENVQIRLMSVHAAKGREFDMVFAVGVEEGFYPHQRSLTALEVEEERRLLFVAASRARRLLRLSWCRERFVFSDRQSRRPSPFLEVLPSSVVHLHAPAVSIYQQPTRRFHAQARPVNMLLPRFVPKQSGLTVDDFSPGQEVFHEIFGKGKVTAKDSRFVTVDFTVGTKSLDVTIAPLKIL